MDDTSLILGRLEGKVDSIQSTLSAIVQRQDAHDHRLNAVEGAVTSIKADRNAIMPTFRSLESDVGNLKSWRSTIEGQARGVGMAANIMKVGAGVLLTIATYFGWQIVVPAPAVQTTVQHYVAPFTSN